MAQTSPKLGRSYRPGDAVQLVTPDNPRLHRADATVVSVESWGCHVHTGAAATGQFRAAWHELDRPGVLTGDICGDCGSANMQRAGTCLVCMDCGSTSGGCG